MTSSGAALRPALVFDLDGTLVDSNYQHALAWQEGLAAIGIAMPVWLIHRRIGMSGGMLANELARHTGSALTRDQLSHATEVHAASFARRFDEVQPLPGARQLLADLASLAVPWAVATSGSPADAKPALALLDIGADAVVITSADVAAAKPDPALFLAATAKIGRGRETFVVGDAVWDMLAARRAGLLPVGVLTGGYSQEELRDAGAYRVFDDAEHLRRSLDLLGIHSDISAPPPQA